jgi:signal transduction histidine kinase/ligand-binding sensor domain-containing protein
MKSRVHFVHFFSKLCLIIISSSFCVACSTELTTEPEIPTLTVSSNISTTIPRPSSALPPPSVRFEHLSVEDGLAHSQVSVILEDQLGFMWFGTQNGLNKYDGHEFETYRFNPDDEGSLRDNFIESLYEDSNGTLWIGTQEGWLERFDRVTGTFTHYEVSSHVYAIVEDSEGALWLGSKDPGLLKFDPQTGDTQNVWEVKDVMSVVIDDDEVIWAASVENGLGIYNPKTEQLAIIEQEYPAHTLVIDGENQLWMATWGGGLGRWDATNEQVEYWPHQPNNPQSPSNDYLSTLHIGTGATLWIGTYQSGLTSFKADTNSFTHYTHDPTDPASISHNSVFSIYQNRSGILWVGGGTGGGISWFSVRADRFGHYRPLLDDPNSLSSALITSITCDQNNNVWIGTFTGLDRWDRVTGVWRNYSHDPADPTSLNDNNVRSVYIDENDTLWIGTEGGLERYDPSIDGFVHHDGPVVMWMNEGLSGRFWMATKSGFFEFDRIQEEFYLIDEGYAWKIMVLEDNQGRVWVGSSGDGVGVYDPRNDSWEHYLPDPEIPFSISDNFIESIHQDQSGTVWLGTGSGLNCYLEDSQTFKSYQVNDGLADDRIAGILEDDQGHLWLATNGGISRFNPDTESFENFTVRDGLQSNIFWRNSYFQGSDGELFFGGDNGFNAFYPENIVPNPRVPPVVITRVSLFNQPLQTDLIGGEALSLNYDENFLSFDFIALDYTDPQQNQYAYQMVGLNPDWIEAGNRGHADYPDLRPGEYIFRVIGSNNDGVWNEVGASVEITIKPPFWQTPWFIGLVILALVGVGYGGFRLRVRSLESRGRELEQEVETRTAELSETNLELQQAMDERERAEQALADAAAKAAVRDERDRLARDLHDSVTQSIYSTTLLAEAGRRLVDSGDVEQAGTTFRRLGQITRQALKEMRLLVYELRPLALEQVGLVAALQGRLDAVERRAGIDARLVVEEGFEADPECEAGLYYLAHEALNNALKHASPTRVEVRLEILETSGCRMDIRDDGAGFDPAEAKESGGLGLVSMQERVEQLGGSFDLESDPGEGTTITVTLPGKIEVDEELS